MRIEIDREAYADKKPVIINFINLEFGGLCLGADVYIPPHQLILLIQHLAHEIGHAYSFLESFQFGPLISRSEAEKISLKLDQPEIAFLKSHLNSPQPVLADNTLLSIIGKAYLAITKGAIAPSPITIHPINSQKELKSLALKHGVEASKTLPNHTFAIHNTKQLRNSESQAYFIQYLICLVIENTIRAYKIDPDFEYKFEAAAIPGHRRGQTIAYRILLANGKVPSQIDLTAKG